jgi:integrase
MAETPKMVKTSTKGIYRRGNSYVVVYRALSGRQRKRFAATLAEARREKANITADIGRGEYREPSRIAFAEYALDWIETYRGRTNRGFGNNARDDYRGALEREALPFFGRMRLVEIEPRHVKKYLAYLEAPQPTRDKHPRQGLAVASVRKTIAPVKALFADAVEEGLLRTNPTAGVRMSAPGEDLEQGDDEQVKALTEDELRELLSRTPDDWRLFFEFLAVTGLRIGEAIEVRWRDVDGRWLHVARRFYRGSVAKPKGRKTRRVPLSEGTAQALWNLRKQTRGGDDDLVFTADRGGRIIPSNLMSRVLKPAAADAGLGEWIKTRDGRRAESWVGFHTFRHSCATMLFRHGWNAVQVCKFLGHADAGFTLRVYVHLLPEDLPEPAFLDAITVGVGNRWATRPSENTRDGEQRRTLKSLQNPDSTRPREMAGAHS